MMCLQAIGITHIILDCTTTYPDLGSGYISHRNVAKKETGPF